MWCMRLIKKRMYGARSGKDTKLHRTSLKSLQKIMNNNCNVQTAYIFNCSAFLRLLNSREWSPREIIDRKLHPTRLVAIDLFKP